MSAVDGTRDEGALAVATGLPEGQVRELLEQLAMVGVLELTTPSDGIDLDENARSYIDRVHALLDVADYYELLALGRDADKRAVKAAYVRVGPAFHPDRHYKKNLGPYKLKIERIFATLTKAHDTLRYSKRRESYDETVGPPRAQAAETHRLVADAASYLGGERHQSMVAPVSDAAPASVPPARGSFSSIPEGRASYPGSRPGASGPPRSSQPGMRAERSTPGRGSQSGPSSHPGAASQPGRIPRAPAIPRARQPISSRPEQSPEALRAQRDALARKLRRNSAVPPPMPPPARQVSEVRTRKRPVGTYVSPDEVRKSAAEKIRKRFDMVGGAMRERRLERYLEQGRVAFAAGDYRAAAAAYEQAARLAPEDDAIVEKARMAAEKAARMG